MSQDIVEMNALRVITAIRQMSDADCQDLIQGLSHDPGLLDSLDNLLDETKAHRERFKPEGPDLISFPLPDGGEHKIPRNFIQGMIHEHQVAVSNYLVNRDKADMAKDLAVLAYTGFPFWKEAIEPFYRNDGSVNFRLHWQEGSILVDGQMFPDILGGKDHRASSAGASAPTIPVRKGPDRPLLANGVEIDEDRTGLHSIDLSKGEGQYISYNSSMRMNPQVGHPYFGVTSEMREFSEIQFRELSGRERLDKLRQVYHTKPSEREGFKLLAVETVGATFLLYKERVLTFAWTQKLPRAPDWMVLERPDLLIRSGGKSKAQRRPGNKTSTSGRGKANLWLAEPVFYG